MELTFAKDVKDKTSFDCHFSSKRLEKDYVGPVLNGASYLVTDAQIAEVLLIGSIPVACRASQDASLSGFMHFQMLNTNQI